MVGNEHVVAQFNELAVEFEKLRADRWQHAVDMVRDASSTNELLADIANVTLILFINNHRARGKSQAFRSTSET